MTRLSSHYLRQLVYRRLLQPRSKTADAQRKELITNVLVGGLTVIAVLASCITTFIHFTKHTGHENSSLLLVLAFTLIFAGLWRLSRRGHFRVTAYAFLVFLGLVATSLLLQWSFELPQVELTYALVIVVASVLLSARAGLIFAGLISSLVLVLSYAQLHLGLHPDLSWLHQTFQFADALGYVVVFGFIGLVSWLSNKEIDRSLARARRSERALQKERDSLEIKVAERTGELEQAQLARVLELERFAEFGRLNAGLLHEVANPLTAASLNLEQLSGTNPSELVVQTQHNLQQLERYVIAARERMQGQTDATSFSVKKELQQVIGLLNIIAQKAGVTIQLDAPKDSPLYGDSVQFSQLAANLISNAIQAYDGLPKTRRPKQVTVSLAVSDTSCIVTVHDRGRGIAETNLSRVFTAFYSHRPGNKPGMGIGLAMVKQFTEIDFHGTITVASDPKDGTTFTVTLPRA